MQKKYPYLSDTDFLKKVDAFPIQEKYVQITLLDYMTETEIDKIEGEITDGSITKDGSSVARISCSLSCNINGFEYDIYDIKSKYSINKKIFVEIGVLNPLEITKEHPEILWFPQGVMIITNFSITSSAGGAVTIQLNFKDKMCLLDGTVGGMFPATTRFDTANDIVDNKYVTKKVPVYQIITEAVNHFGGEALENILIEDIPDKAKRALKWNSSTPLWLLQQGEQYIAKRQDAFNELDSAVYSGTCYRAGYDVGFVYEDFVYDKELTFAAGSTVVQLLNTIKDWLGNFEYFYDEFGIFHFREIKNYLNTSLSTYEWVKNFKDEDYVYNPINAGYVYDFSDKANINNITANPQYQNIKNDYIIIGKSSSDSGSNEIIYHFVIDDKPIAGQVEYDNILLYTDSSTKKYALAYPQILTEEDFNKLTSGDIGQVYGVVGAEKEINFSKNATTELDFNNLISDFRKRYEALDVNSSSSVAFWEYYEDDLNKENIRKKIDKLLYNVALEDSISTLRPVALCLLEQFLGYYESKANHKIIAGEVDKLKKYCLSKIEADSFYTETIKQYYETIMYCLTEDDKYKDGYDAIWKTYYPQFIQNVTIQGKTDEWVLFALSNCFKDYSNVLKDASLYQSFYDANDTRLKNIKSCLTDIDYIISSDGIDMYKTDSNRYKQMTDLKELLEEAKNLIQTMTSEAYRQLQLNIQPQPTFSTITINQTYKDTQNYIFYVWDGEGEWESLDWEYYYNKDGGLHNIDLQNELIQSYLLEHSDVDLKVNSDWYKKFVNYITAHQELNSRIETVQENQLNSYVAEDWRTEIILQGLLAEKAGTKKSEYYAELLANWPIIYNLKTQSYYNSTNLTDDFYSGKQVVLNNESASFSGEDGEVTIVDDSKVRFTVNGKTLEINTGYVNNTITGSYYFDMLDAASSKWGEYSVSNIGCRRLVVKNDSVNSLFTQPLPNNGFIFNSGKTSAEIIEERALIQQNGSNEIYNVGPDVSNYFATGGSSSGAYDILRYNLLTHIDYQETINLSVKPVYYLQPNTLLKVFDETTGIAGEYVSKTISIPLKGNGLMTISATKAQEKV